MFVDTDVICKFAQFEFRFGEPWHGASLFESIVTSYPKRTDVWSVYIDLVTKSEKIEDAR